MLVKEDGLRRKDIFLFLVNLFRLGLIFSLQPCVHFWHLFFPLLAFALQILLGVLSFSVEVYEKQEQRLLSFVRMLFWPWKCSYILGPFHRLISHLPATPPSMVLTGYPMYTLTVINKTPHCQAGHWAKDLVIPF
ncbi:Proline-, glutamic acid- and leucine-rich protein [Actinidia chinensis var. chinensis]|uniref:Proline-, glutamic acid-and leucine-rich protein n=1 Tax=Actinidia chinensis var. chinensis TaxID=1590841 RepID=A0A2R6PKW8_ACTCC|nr:Proline-, glutamic acid- and leucine-rich protein [Actinidia chinensis var. chinensis]